MIAICPLCGNIEKKHEFSIEDYCSCGEPISGETFFPRFEVQQFISIGEDLYDKCKQADRDNVKKFIEFSRNFKNCEFSHEEIMKYVTIIESIKSKYSANTTKSIGKAYDEFEDIIISKYKIEYEKISTFVAGDAVYFRNQSRKPFIIIVASIIEMLFNDFFRILVIKRLGNNGGNVFLSRYDHAGIKECIDICNAFLEKSLKLEMDSLKKGFFDKWNTLRTERNSIVHSNSKYISKKRTSEVYKLIDESQIIFSNLISQIYSKKI